jgi:nitrogen fixation protein NifB
VYRGITAADLLLRCQTEGIKLLKAAGIAVKINTVIIPGINDSHAVEVAAWAAEAGADIQNCIPMVPVEGTVFENLEPPSPEFISALRIDAGRRLPQMSHCARCRADAAGLLDAGSQRVVEKLLEEAACIKPSEERPYVAVATMEGFLVNRHLGEAAGLWIYGLDGDRPVLKERRPAPPPGTGDQRWETLASILGDCFAVLASGCGPNPRRILQNRGIKVILGDALIADIAEPLLHGREIPRIYTASPVSCGRGYSCRGDGMGCGAR